jgi:regulator of protease activity HflC (stomatin/prohibitin superfamily)
MGIGGLLGLVALVAFVVFLAGIGSVVLAASQGRPVRSGVLLAVVGLVGGILFSIIAQGLLILQPQEVAVVFNTLTGNLDQPRRAGTHVIIPVVQQATIYPIAQQEYTMSGTFEEGSRQGDDAVRARTIDGQEIRMDVTIIFGIDPEQANIVHQRWQNRYIDDFIRPTARGIVRDVVSGFRAAAIYGAERGSMESQITEQMTVRMQEEGLVLTDLLVRDITFTEDFAASIERAQIAEQRSAEARFQVEQRRAEAEQARAVAEGERDAEIARAEGEAQAIILRAQAEAEGLRLVSEQIQQNPALVQYEYVRRLSENVNIALVPANSPFLFDFATLAASAESGVPATDGLGAQATEEPSPIPAPGS